MWKNPSSKDVFNGFLHITVKVLNRYIKDEDEKMQTGEVWNGCSDFGIARQLEKTSSGLSKKGTYTYMAPPVWRQR